MSNSPHPSRYTDTPSVSPLCDVTPASTKCSPEADEHCLTCGDIAVEALIVQVNAGQGTARVAVDHTIEEIDISLLDTVAVGDTVLVHGGVALERCSLAVHGEEVDADD